ncbi:hypothetical protein PSP6_10087 [Paraburkholderia tropica]|nr:hypothetical protein PSP6_10087 [Paraburkholderia tropica]
MTGTAHKRTLSKTHAAKGSHLLQIAIADAAVLVRDQSLYAYFVLRKPASAPHRGVDAVRRRCPVRLT